MRLRICVFCGAKPGSPAAGSLADETGRLIGAAGHHLVWGGGGAGLMGVVSWAAYRSGATLTGVVPRFLYERERAIKAPPHDVVFTDTMSERKRLMIDRADAFIALPGGYGTMDEVLEVLSLCYLAVCAKPVVLLGDDGFWDEFTALDGALRRRGYVDPRTEPGFVTATTAADALDLLTGPPAADPLELTASPSPARSAFAETG